MTFVSILADLNYLGVWMVSISSRIFTSSSPLIKTLWTIQRAPIIHGITVTLCSQASSKYLSTFSIPLIFTLWCAGMIKSTIRQVLLFSVNSHKIWYSNLVHGICCHLKNSIFCASSSKTDSGLCIYNLVVWSNFNFLLISQWVTLSFYTPFAAFLLYSLIIVMTLLESFSHQR